MKQSKPKSLHEESTVTSEETGPAEAVAVMDARAPTQRDYRAAGRDHGGLSRADTIASAHIYYGE